MIREHCDGPGCDKNRPVEGSINDWLIVSKHGWIDASLFGDPTGDWLFCGYECLRNWADSWIKTQPSKDALWEGDDRRHGYR